jgi:hypothetical protein
LTPVEAQVNAGLDPAGYSVMMPIKVLSGVLAVKGFSRLLPERHLIRTEPDCEF